MACTLLPSRYLVLGLLFNREVIKVDGFGDGRDIPNQPKRPRMPGNWFNRVHKKFLRQSHRNIVVPHSNACSGLEESRASNITEEIDSYGKGLYIRVSPSSKKELTEEDFAAIKIQAIFRGHLARRAFRALRSLVKLQALVRGAYVRKQSGIALQCMHAVVRLQVRIRARQLLNRCSDN